jgi:hypothetical protein
MSDAIQLVDATVFKKEVEGYYILFAYFSSKLTTQKEVGFFLGKSSQTISTMVKEKVLIEGIHYTKEDGKTVWLPEGIINFKLNPPKKEPKKQPYQPSQEAVKILQ